MGNILNNNFNNLKLRFNNEDYWDFFVCKDNNMGRAYFSEDYAKECLISYIDAEDKFCIEGEGLRSKDEFVWESALTTSDYVLENIGLTGFDNALISFQKDRILNSDFVKLYLESEYQVNEDKNLHLHKVSGSTMVYEYPLTFEEGQIKLNGGFFQGFMETECDKYQVLPTKMENNSVWHFEFVLKKSDLEKESDKTLNDFNPNNKGIFFYLGTRAENKWIYEYEEKEEDSCKVFSMTDYIEGEEDNKHNIAINSFTDMSTDFFCVSTVFNGDYWRKTVNEIGDYVNLSPYVSDNPTDDEFYDLFDEINMGGINENNQQKVNPLLIEEELKDCGKCTKKSLLNSEMDMYLSDTDDLSCYLDGDDEYDYVANDLDITDFEVLTTTDINVKINGLYYIDTTNKFLTFDRTCNGFNVHNWDDSVIYRYYGRRNGFQGNLFLLMNRTCTGYNVNTIDEYRNSFLKKYNIYKDLYNNALAFRITDSGAIGYRYLTLDCQSETQTTIKEGYSFDNVIKEDEWCTINVAIHISMGKMRLYFYVNGKLVFVTDEMDKLNMRELNDLYEKQETVPYNISLGGGTQGLADVILPNYMIEPYRTYPLEENFAGTFIGYLKSFKFYNCSMGYELIKNNFIYEKSKLT